MIETSINIHKLSHDVIEKIAAGEVLERPANMLKELLENSLDAGSTSIEVDFDNGGRTLKITDNGHGIEETDLELALQRHATSKIKDSDDIWNLQTYGFRGEALASIASVSDMVLLSRTHHQKQGALIRSNYGVVKPIEKRPSDVGTEVTIQNLFENVPARLKFLKTPSAEATQLKKVFKAIALSNPSVVFRLKQAGQLLQFYPKQSEKERAEAILGVRLYEAHGEYSNIEVKAFLASPSDVQKTSQNIFIFVQNRIVTDKTIQAAIIEAYRSLLMHGEYPLCVLKVKCPPDFVDVNIHPTKAQVKFQNQSVVFRAVHSVLRDTIEKAPWRPQVLKESQQDTEMNSFVQAKLSNPSLSSSEPRLDQLGFDGAAESFQQAYFKQKNYHHTHETNDVSQHVEERKVDYTIKENGSETDVGFWSGLQVLAQLSQTYIIAQSRQSLILVDQHAAHERVVYEKLMQSIRAGKIDIQNFLIPLNVEMQEDQVTSILSIENDLFKFGLHIDRLSPTALSVRAAPSMISEKAIIRVLFMLAHEIEQKGGSFAFEKVLSDICATMACHSVVRAGQSLSHDEMKELLKSMDQYPLSGYCPHGRPVYVDFSFYQLDRMFGRIV